MCRNRLPESPIGEPVANGVLLGQAFAFWLKLGFVSFGGPAGQIALMHAELVERRGWISETRFMHALKFCMILPGPEAQQLATYLGWLLHKTRGGIIAGVLFVLPSLFLMIALAWLTLTFGNAPLVAGLLYGIKPAVTALVAQAGHRMGLRVLKSAGMWLLAAGAFLAVFLFATPFPLVIAVAALIGILTRPKDTLPSQHANLNTPVEPTPNPPHTQFRMSRLISELLAGFALWLVPMALLVSLLGWDHTLTRMAWFFTKAALLTFGGAYAVLPYVYQGAVVQFGWLTPSQMMDGLGLGETTPGPLIMVVAYVAFAGGYGQMLFGAEERFLAGAVAAVLVTWFTFLPSFLFIFAGGPLVESMHKTTRFDAPLNAVSAAAVGVILNLAVFFALHVFWPQGLNAAIDWVSVMLAALACVALMGLRLSPMLVIVACGMAGFLARSVWHN